MIGFNCYFYYRNTTSRTRLRALQGHGEHNGGSREEREGGVAVGRGTNPFATTRARILRAILQMYVITLSLQFVLIFVSFCIFCSLYLLLFFSHSFSFHFFHFIFFILFVLMIETRDNVVPDEDGLACGDCR